MAGPTSPARRPGQTPGRYRVALMINTLRQAGAETQIVHLAEALVDRGHDVSLVSILPNEAFLDRMAAIGVTPHVVGGDDPRPASTVRRTVRLLRQLRPDALVSFTYQSNALGLIAGRLARVPVIITSLRNERFGARRELVLRALLGRSPVVVNSERAAERLAQRRIIDARRTTVIPNQIELAVFEAARRRREEVRAELGWAPDELVWLAIGRLEPQKDHETLLRAFESVLAGRDKVRLVIVGDGALRADVEARAATLDERVELVGHRSDVPRLLGAADGLVLSSRWEGLPNVVMEAMAAGLPVVATDVGGVSELVEDGVTGRLVPAGDPASLGAAVHDVMALPPEERARLGAAGRQRVARYSPAAVDQLWLDLLNRRLGVDTPSRVSLFIPSYSGGGAQRVFMTLPDLLVDRGWDAELIVGRAAGELAAEAPQRATVVDLGGRRTIGALPNLMRHLRRRRPAVLLSTLDHANVTAFLAARLASRTTKVALRSSNTTSVQAARAGGADRLMYALARRLYPRADALVAPARSVAADLESWLGIPEGSVEVVPNPVVTEALLGTGDERPAHPWFRPGGPPVILAVGRMEPHKCYLRLLDAFAEVRRTEDARLLILGDGPERPALEARTAALGLELGPDGDVDLPGFDPEPYAYFRAAHVYALASEVEGLPGALIQALASGTKVVAADAPGGAAEILDGGRFGRLVPMGDTGALAEALRAAVSDPPGGPGMEACERFTAAAAVSALESLLLRLTGTDTPVSSGAVR